MTQGDSYLSNHEASLVLWESSHLHKMSEKLTALDEVHQEEDAEVIFEHVVHAHDERMLNRVQDLLLQLQRIHLLVFQYNILSNALHSINLFGFFMSHLENFSKSSFSNNSHHFKVIKFCIFLLRVFVLSESFDLARNALLDLIVLIWVLLLWIIFMVLGFLLLLLTHGQSLLVCHLLGCLLFDLVALFLADILVLVPELKRREFVILSLPILLGGGEAFEVLLLDVENAQVFVVDLVEHHLQDADDCAPPKQY